MEIKRYETSARYSRIVTHNNTVYLCGQVGSDLTSGIKEQTAQTLEKIDKLLAQVGTDKTKILSVTIYIRDMKDFAAMNEVWDAWTPEGQTSVRACVEARMSDPDELVEMSVIAAM